MQRNYSQNQKPFSERHFINEAELEILTGISKRTWQKHRLFGRGPRFYRLCGAVRYDLAEVLEWIEGNAVGIGEERGRRAAEAKRV
jgi:predicted DNA-binding transcriptional regulator AlpA